MRKLEPALALLLGAALLTGCATGGKSQEPRRLLLAYEGPAAAVVSNGPRPRLVVRGVDVPDYLDRREMVRRLSDAEISRDSHAQWAERPGKSITRWVAQALAAQRSDYAIESYTTSDGRAPDAVLAIVIESFEPAGDGTLRLRGGWSYAVNGRPTSKAGRFDADAVTASSSPEAYVAALQKALTTAVHQLAADLPATKMVIEPPH